MTDLRSALRVAAHRAIVLSLPQVPLGFMTDREVESGETVRVGVGVQLSVILMSLCFSSAVGPVESFSLGIMREGRGEEVPVVVRGRLEETVRGMVGEMRQGTATLMGRWPPQCQRPRGPRTSVPARRQVDYLRKHSIYPRTVPGGENRRRQTVSRSVPIRLSCG